MNLWRTSLSGLALTTSAMLLLPWPTNLGASPSRSQAAERRAFAEKVLASTNAEWIQYFTAHGRIYQAPMTMFMQLPEGHPARGFGYIPRLGVYVDLSDMIDIQQVQPASANLITALILAHEVAHHVQREVKKTGQLDRASVMARELEADCAAGWWLSKANARSRIATGKPFLVAQDLAAELARALNLLTGREGGGRSIVNVTHGEVGDRVSAIELGMRSQRVEVCGAGIQF